MATGSAGKQDPIEIDGSYTRREGAQYSYAYFASIFETEKGYRWTAEVWRDGRVKGAPGGHIGKHGRPTTTAAVTGVREMVLHCIEYLIEIDE